jgi:hypothetical protein
MTKATFDYQNPESIRFEKMSGGKTRASVYPVE